MLQLTNGSIMEGALLNSTFTGSSSDPSNNTFTVENCQTLTATSCNQPYTYWYSYPVYVCSDKTAKAIEILKQLQKEKLIDCKSVPKFIELVEKISGIL